MKRASSLFISSFSPDEVSDLHGGRYARCTVICTKVTTHFEAGGDVFNGNDGMAGLKWSSWEGGTRIPYLVRFPGRIDAGSLSNHILTNYDFMPTLAELIGAELPQGKDGISFLPTLLGRDEEQQTHPFVVYASGLGPALVTADNWKLRYINSENRFQLYDLNQDYREEQDVAAAQPEIVDRLSEWLLNACDGDYQHGTPGAHLAAYAT